MKTFLSIFLATAFVGCAATPHDSDIRAIAIQVFGTDTHLVVHRERIFHASLDGGAPNDTRASDLWNDMQLGETANLDLVVRGNSSATDTFTIEHALWIGKAHKLPYLRLLFIGDPKDAKRIRPVVEAHGAQFYFRQK